MAIDYSTLDTIQNYDSLFKEFYNQRESYNELDNNSRLIYLTAGLGLTNSIHEKFIKSMIAEYINIYKLSNKKREKVIQRYKSPNKLIEFVELLQLDLNEAFEFMKRDIQEKFELINSVESLMSILKEQRNNRNDYLHGDFNFSDEILLDTFQENIIDFQEVHNFILKITRYSFIKNRDNLPNISELIVSE